MENIINCPYCLEDIKKNAVVCKHCWKKVEFKLKELEKTRIKRARFEGRKDKNGWELINHIDEHRWVYIILIFVIFFTYISYDEDKWKIELPNWMVLCSKQIENTI